MPPSPARKRSNAKAPSANRGFEAKLWLSADKLRNNMAAAEPSVARQTAAGSPKGERGSAKQYLAANVFWVPKEARWSHLQANAKLPSIGKDVDDAMVALERDNPRLKGALNKNYGRADLDKHRLDDLIGSIQLVGTGSKSKDLLGQVFMYFLRQFASAEGKNGGHSSGARKTAAGSQQGERGGVHQFYTPSCVVQLLVEMLAHWVCGPNIEPHYLKYVLFAENEALWRFPSGTTHQTIY